MTDSHAKALQLKDEGNKLFQAGDWIGAEALYSKAILADANLPALYTNRALSRMKLDMLEDVIADCEACLRFGDNAKAHYVLAEVKTKLGQHDEALGSARKAHQMYAETNDKNLAKATSLVLECKKCRWYELERKRIREAFELETQLIEMLEAQRDQCLAECQSDLDRQSTKDEWGAKIALLKKICYDARAPDDKIREVPDWAIDEISFSFMVDPVITKSGKSYERTSIMEHFKRAHTDPLTREPLNPQDLVPNLGLREACEDFLAKNGWAADW